MYSTLYVNKGPYFFVCERNHYKLNPINTSYSRSIVSRKRFKSISQMFRTTVGYGHKKRTIKQNEKYFKNKRHRYVKGLPEIILVGI